MRVPRPGPCAGTAAQVFKVEKSGKGGNVLVLQVQGNFSICVDNDVPRGGARRRHVAA